VTWNPDSLTYAAIFDRLQLDQVRVFAQLVFLCFSCNRLLVFQRYLFTVQCISEVGSRIDACKSIEYTPQSPSLKWLLAHTVRSFPVRRSRVLTVVRCVCLCQDATGPTLETQQASLAKYIASVDIGFCGLRGVSAERVVKQLLNEPPSHSVVKVLSDPLKKSRDKCLTEQRLVPVVRVWGTLCQHCFSRRVCGS
jgi:hypothetical protein